ncbi:GapA-binding peptide SR1P [Alkalihalobacillus pseudalcaliphilus]|uniref:GapA-binding peptide SR1P n=1 Tax=Alkalihalobacillus pseudalcaliphilus TaxID=79884 RepID=UPI00235FA46A|nr:GapA-binding peptide SR1P [Alkalihalobacillus pseudalcaliphilus]
MKTVQCLSNQKQNQLGTLICQDCQSVIDTFDCEKVQTFHTVSQKCACKQKSLSVAS